MTGRALAEQLAFFGRNLGVVGWTGIFCMLIALALVFAVRPQVHGENVQAQMQVEALSRRLEVLRDPRYAKAARDPVATLVESLPLAAAIPEFVAAIQRRADRDAVQIDRTEYRVQSVLGHAAQRYRLSFPAHVDYPKLRTWLEALLHDYPSLSLDELSLHREVDGGEELDAQLGLSFLAQAGK